MGLVKTDKNGLPVIYHTCPECSGRTKIGVRMNVKTGKMTESYVFVNHGPKCLTGFQNYQKITSHRRINSNG